MEHLIAVNDPVADVSSVIAPEVEQTVLMAHYNHRQGHILETLYYRRMLLIQGRVVVLAAWI